MSLVPSFDLGLVFQWAVAPLGCEQAALCPGRYLRWAVTLARLAQALITSGRQLAGVTASACSVLRAASSPGSRSPPRLSCARRSGVDAKPFPLHRFRLSRVILSKDSSFLDSSLSAVYFMFYGGYGGSGEILNCT